MYCEECQHRPATLHFTKIVNGEKTEFHICEQCAKEKGDVIPGSNSFSIHHLLSGLLNFEPISEVSNHNEKASDYQCGKCKMSYRQFAKSGRFGCANCYEVFSTKLEPLLKKIHSGNSVHSGKIPLRIGSKLVEKRQIENLRQLLQKHIQQEEFEKAAEVRDQIRHLEHRFYGIRGKD